MLKHAKIFRIALITASALGSLQWMPNHFPHGLI
jgi:hypothetical protein